MAISIAVSGLAVELCARPAGQMSHSHIKVPKQRSEPPSASFRVFAVFAVAVSICTVLYLVWMAATREHTSVRGTVVDARIDVVGSRESNFGGYIVYQIQAQVKYRPGSLDQVRWMPASDISGSKELLVATLAAHPKLCSVTWEVGHPDNPRCQFPH